MFSSEEEGAEDKNAPNILSNVNHEVKKPVPKKLFEEETEGPNLDSPLQSMQPLLYKGGNKVPKPERNTQFLRLYNHNICPYSATARYALATKKLQF